MSVEPAKALMTVAQLWRGRWLASVRSSALTISGLGFICAAGWSVAKPLGLLLVGLALLALEYLSGGSDGG